MGHVFVSYKNSDELFAAELIRQIEDAGYQVWSDDEQLHAGELWGESIDQAIRDAFALIVIMTPAAKTAEQVTYEWTFALGVGVRVILVMLEPVEIPSRLLVLPALDFVDPASRPWGRLIRLVQEARDRHQRPAFSTSRTDRLPPRPAMPPAAPPSPSLLDRFRRFPASDEQHAVEDSDPPPENENRLVERLDGDDRDARIAAARRLGEKGCKSAVPALIKLLRDDDWRVRDAAAQALGKLKAAAAVPALLETLRVGRPGPFGNNNNSTVITWAIREIGVLAIPVLIDALGDEDWRIRLFATDVLGEIADSDATNALTEALHDPEWRVRWRAAEALGKVGNTAAVSDLCEALRDSTKDVRISAAWALGRIGNEQAVPHLIRLLHERDWRVRWAAAEALWVIGAAAAPFLVEVLRDRDDYVRRAAIRALAEIGEGALPCLLETLSDTNWDVRWAAAEALQEMGHTAVPSLVQVLTGENWRASWAAAEALKQIGTPEALEAVEAWRRGQENEPPE